MHFKYLFLSTKTKWVKLSVTGFPLRKSWSLDDFIVLYITTDKDYYLHVHAICA